MEDELHTLEIKKRCIFPVFSFYTKYCHHQPGGPGHSVAKNVKTNSYNGQLATYL